MNLTRLLLLVGSIGFVLWLLEDGAVSHAPGVLVAQAPQQTAVRDQAPFDHGEYRITPLAGFALQARVLGREDYRLDREADLSPVDLALGWGPMSDEAVLEQIEISQGGRWYRWRAQGMPLPRREIERHSANMHMVPQDAQVADALDAVRTGDVVELQGYLIEARAADGWRWRSSLTRNDTGARSCELVYVRRLTIAESP